MKRRMLVGAMLMLCAEAHAFQDKGFYQELRYRDNDPFLFCTQGQKEPDKCWWPIDPISATYMEAPWCDPPNEYGKPWTSADWDSLSQYQEICPKAMSQGSWDGRNGSPDMTPSQH